MSVCVCIWCLSFVLILQESSFNALVTGCDLVAIISSHRLCLTRFLLFCLSFVYLYLSLACNLLSVSQCFLVTMEKEFYTQAAFNAKRNQRIHKKYDSLSPK